MTRVSFSARIENQVDSRSGLSRSALGVLCVVLKNLKTAPMAPSAVSFEDYPSLRPRRLLPSLLRGTAAGGTGERQPPARFFRGGVFVFYFWMIYCKMRMDKDE